MQAAKLLDSRVTRVWKRGFQITFFDFLLGGLASNAGSNMEAKG